MTERKQTYVVSLLKIQNTGWNIKLFQTDNTMSDYLCNHCGNVCCDAVELGCNEHKDDEYYSYCDNCLRQIIANNNEKCPINSHSNPIIIPSRGFRRNILNSMVICPYSLNGCQFKGCLNDLLQSSHLKECSQQCNEIESKDEPNDCDMKQRLITFYKLYNPTKLNDPEAINEILCRYKGKEQQLFDGLENKYILPKHKHSTTFSKTDIKKKLEHISLFQANEILQALSTKYHQHIIDDNPMEIEEKSENIKLQYNKEKNIILVHGFSRKHIAYFPHDLILTICMFYHSENIPLIESLFAFSYFNGEPLQEIDFTCKPMVLLLGPHSTGKTTFIRYLIGKDFPAMHIALAPTTDTFCVIMDGLEDKIIRGPVAACDRMKPFMQLQKCGDGFLHKFDCIEVTNAPILKHITFIDTPGILSGQKGRIGCNYNKRKVIEWFAQKCDKICLFFNAKRLNISDEYKAMLYMLKPYNDKICCILNKADSVGHKELLCSYGTMLWSLGRIFKQPDVFKIYVGSFWENEYTNNSDISLFNSYTNDLIDDLVVDLPKKYALVRINMFVKRIQRLKVCALVINHLQKLLENDSSWLWNSKDKIFDILKSEMKKVAKMESLDIDDFPNPEKFKSFMTKYDITKFPKFKQKWRNVLDTVLNIEIPKLKLYYDFGFAIWKNPTTIWSGTWAIDSNDFEKYSVTFYRLSLRSGKASGSAIKDVMLESGLPFHTLKNVWDLSDIDEDGKMDIDEFVLCMHLIQTVKDGATLPSSLPTDLVPPSKRHLF